MRYQVKVVGKRDVPKDQRIVLDHARIKGEDYSDRELLQFCTIGSRLENCRFNNVRIENALFGSGRHQSEFVECSFDGAQMYMGPGGCARFVRCSFQNVKLRHWICFAVELVNCTFSGSLSKAIFNGTVKKDTRIWLGRDRNEFVGNGFSEMELINVNFRTGIDLSQQRLPSGPDYLYLPNAASAVARARSLLANLPQDTELRRIATIMIQGMEKSVADGQQQLFLRENDYSHASLSRDAVKWVFSTLSGAKRFT